MPAWGVAWTGARDAEGEEYERRLPCQGCGLAVYFHDSEEERAEAQRLMSRHRRDCSRVYAAPRGKR